MLTIRTPRSQAEFLTACSIVQTIYQSHGYVEALKSNPSTLFLAEEDGAIIGSVGIFTDNDFVLPTEVYYGFSVEDLFPGIDRSQVFEIGRLASFGSSGSLVLAGFVLAICKLAESRGYTRAIACLKPRLLALLEKRIGVVLHTIPYLIVERAVEREYRGYFLSDPRPEAVSMTIEDMAEYLPNLEEHLEGKVEIQIARYEDIVFHELATLTA